MPSGTIVELDAAGCDELAGSLGDAPETVIAGHILRRRLCSAHVARRSGRLVAAVLRPSLLPEEPIAIGPDAVAIWAVLRGLPGWTYVSVTREVAPRLGPILGRELGRAIRVVEDIFHVLDRPGDRSAHPAVRPLGVGDLALLEGSTGPIRAMARGFGPLAGLLREGAAAGAIVDGNLVALACTTALSAGHADLGVATAEGWRGRGLATACAGLAGDAVLRSGRTPVWSTGEDNLASLRVARKLGYREVGRGIYLVPAAPADRA